MGEDLPLPAPTAQRWLWALAGALALVASTIGAVDPAIYDRLVPTTVLPGAFGQDVTTIAAALGLLLLAAFGGRRARGQLVALGLVGYLFSAYGVLVIERTYNELYLVYLAVFALSIWTLASAAVAIARGRPEPVRPPGWARAAIAAGALLQPLVLIPLWVVALLPLVAERRQVDSLPSVHILDVAVIMPAFGIAAVLVLRRRPSGLLSSAVLFVLGAVLMLSLAASALVGPLFGVRVSLARVLPLLLLTVLFAGLARLALRYAGLSALHGRQVPAEAGAPPVALTR